MSIESANKCGGKHNFDAVGAGKVRARCKFVWASVAARAVRFVVIPGGWFQFGGARGRAMRQLQAQTTALLRKPCQTKGKAFPNHTCIANMHRIHIGLAPMIVLVGIALLIAILAFAFVPLAMGRAAQTLTRWLTGRD